MENINKKINDIVAENLNVVVFAIRENEHDKYHIWLKCTFDLDEEEVYGELKNIACKCVMDIEEVCGFEINVQYSTIIFLRRINYELV